jgi:hypothetical protein
VDTDLPSQLANERRAPSLRRALIWSLSSFTAMVAATIAACGGGGDANGATPPPAGTGPAKATVLGASLASP